MGSWCTQVYLARGNVPSGWRERSLSWDGTPKRRSPAGASEWMSRPRLEWSSSVRDVRTVNSAGRRSSSSHVEWRPMRPLGSELHPAGTGNGRSAHLPVIGGVFARSRGGQGCPGRR